MRAAEYASYDGLGLAELIRKGDLSPRARTSSAFLAHLSDNPVGRE